jgi:hypothetical protein
MKITTQYIEKLIIQARESGASPSEIEELEDYLEQIKSGKLNHQADKLFTERKENGDGRIIVRISTAPLTTDTE